MKKMLATELTERVHLVDPQAKAVCYHLTWWLLSPSRKGINLGYSYAEAVTSLNRRYGLSLDPQREII